MTKERKPLIRSAASLTGHAMGFLNLLHLAIELAILSIVLMYLLLTSRDGVEFSLRLAEESRRDPVTRLPNINAMFHRLATAPPRRAEMAANRSSQKGMEWNRPFDLVADVRCFAGRFDASSKAKRITRSTPMRVNTLSCTTNSRSVPSNMRPPTLEYSPSVFSRTM